MSDVERNNLTLLLVLLGKRNAEDRAADAEEFVLLAVPSGKPGVRKELEDEGILLFEGEKLIEIGDVEYTVEVSSPDVKVTGGSFTIETKQLQQEWRDTGYFLHTCRVERGASVNDKVFHVHWSLVGEYWSGPKRDNSNNSHFCSQSSDDMEKLSEGLEGLWGSPGNSVHSKLRKRRTDSGFSERSRISGQSDFLQNEDDGSKLPNISERNGHDDYTDAAVSSSSSSDGRDYYGADSP